MTLDMRPALRNTDFLCSVVILWGFVALQRANACGARYCYVKVLVLFL